MAALGSLFKFQLFVMYLFGCVFYMLVSAGIAMLASSLLGESQLRKRPALEFSISAIAAFVACIAPPMVNLLMHDAPSLSVPVVVALFSLYMDHRNLSAGVMEPVEWWGDLTGFGVGLTSIGLWAFAAWHFGGTQFTL